MRLDWTITSIERDDYGIEHYEECDAINFEYNPDVLSEILLLYRSLRG